MCYLCSHKCNINPSIWHPFHAPCAREAKAMHLARHIAAHKTACFNMAVEVVGTTRRTTCSRLSAWRMCVLHTHYNRQLRESDSVGRPLMVSFDFCAVAFSVSERTQSLRTTSQTLTTKAHTRTHARASKQKNRDFRR